MSRPSPVHLGQYSALAVGDNDEFSIDWTNDLDSGDTVISATVAILLDDVPVAGAVTGIVTASPYTSWRISVAAAGIYLVEIVGTMSDGRSITHTADLWIV